MPTPPAADTPTPSLRADGDASALEVWMPDVDDALAEVHLEARYGLADQDRAFARVEGGWALHARLAPVRRLEYKISLRHRGGDDWETITDPAAPDTAETAFGPISVVYRVDYAPPSWMAAEVADDLWHRVDLAVTRRGLGAAVPVQVLTPPSLAPDQPAPLLLAHDGAEMDRLAGLGRYAAVVQERVPAFRIALISPVHRDRWYAANATYADALVEAVLPAVAEQAPVIGRPVALGASLGALSLAFAQRRHPDAFAGLALQSGSFFTPEHDPHMATYNAWDRVSGAVTRMIHGALRPAGIPTAFSCGVAEENLANNEHMRDVFRRQGYPCTWHEFADGHNFRAWADAWDPSLTELLERCFQ